LEKLKDRISYLGTDLEEVNEKEITVEIFPDRPDMLSVQGFARAFSSFIGVKTGLFKYDVKPSGEKLIVNASVKNVRPYTSCAIVKNLKFDDEKIKEVIDIQEKLHITYGRNRKKVAIGIYPMEHIKFPITFCAKKPSDIKFRPLEFNKEMNAKEILEKHPAGKSYGHLLDNMQLYPLFIDANNEVLSMPPIINSHNVGKINEHTKDVFIECSGFDFEILKKSMNMIAAAFAEMGGQIYSMELVYNNKKIVSPDLSPQEMKVDIDYINTLLGLELKENDVKKLFEKMGYGYKNKHVQIPAYRADIIHQSDLAEDIAIAYGFENFEAIIPNVATIGQENSFEIFKNKLADLLVGMKFLEATTYTITNKGTQCTKMNSNIDVIELSNSISSDYNVLRAWVLPDLIQILAENKHHEYPQRVFTTGRIFKKDSVQETGLLEQERLAVVIASEDTDYTKMRQIIDYLLTSFGLPFKVLETDHTSFGNGRVARISVNDKKIAYVGEINPIVLENWELEIPVTALELNVTELFDIIKKKA